MIVCGMRAHPSAALLSVFLVACGTKSEPGAPAVSEPEPAPSNVKAPSQPTPRSTVAIKGGDVWLFGSACGLTENEITKEKLQTKQTTAAFTIDVDTVSCAEWEACVAAGACKAFTTNETGSASRFCLDDKARVDWQAARAFCEWHGARLPKSIQWLRAAHGDEKFPNAHLTPRCGQQLNTDVSSPTFPCKSSEGMMFRIAALGNEWTSDEDCNFRGERKPVVITTSDVFTVNRPIADNAWFRCAH